MLLVLVALCLGLTSCASNGGVFGGGSWQASGLSRQDIQALAVDPDHIQYLFAGDTQAGVFASTDAGVSWQARSAGLPLPLIIHALAFDTTGKKLYAATSVGLFVSSDLASSWTRVNQLVTDNYSALAFDINTPQVIYVASASAGVWMSRDAGQSWTSVSKGVFASPLTSVLYDANQKNLWAATTDAIYRSNNAGSSWQVMDRGLPSHVGIRTLTLGAVSSTNSDLIFAGTDHGFFITSDAGQQWAQSQFSLASIKVGAVLLDANQPTVVYAATDIGVLRSNDSGQTWSAVGTGLPNNQVFTSIAQGDANYGQLFVASQGVYRYPGSTTSVSPSRVLPALLILLFFLILYFFFILRRRRHPAHSLPPAEPDESPSAEPPGDHTLNGHRPLSDDASKNERQGS